MLKSEYFPLLIFLTWSLAWHHYLCAQVHSQICKCKDVALKMLVVAVKFCLACLGQVTDLVHVINMCSIGIPN